MSQIYDARGRLLLLDVCLSSSQHVEQAMEQALEVHRSAVGAVASQLMRPPPSPAPSCNYSINNHMPSLPSFLSNKTILFSSAIANACIPQSTHSSCRQRHSAAHVHNEPPSHLRTSIQRAHAAAFSAQISSQSCSSTHILV